MIIDKIPVRIGSALIDQISLPLSGVIFSIPKLIYGLVNDLQSTVQLNNDTAVYEAIILFSIFLNKDIFFGRSIGKYLTGLRVVSVKTGNPAGPIQCSVRNLFVLLWPLEVIMLFFSPDRRIGDIIAGTRVQESTVTGHEEKWRVVPATISIVASFTIVYFLFMYIESLGIMN
jgi:uncharacterized RDD family membrane protein YckC